MEQAQDRSGRKAFKVTMMGCFGILAAIIIVVILMAACTLVVSGGSQTHDKGAGQKEKAQYN